MKRTRKQPASRPDPTQQYIHQQCLALESDADREALLMICSVGVFAVEDPSKLSDTVDRLRGADTDGAIRKTLVIQNRIEDAATLLERRKAIEDLDNLRLTDLEQSIDAAYLLGIAVGRRLGPHALQLPKKGGAR